MKRLVSHLAAGVIGGIAVAASLWVSPEALAPAGWFNSATTGTPSTGAEAPASAGVVAAPRRARESGVGDARQALSPAAHERSASLAEPESGSLQGGTRDSWPMALQNELEFLREELDSARRDRLELGEALNALQRQMGDSLADTAYTGESIDSLGIPDGTDSGLANNGLPTPSPNTPLASLEAAGLDTGSARDLLARRDRAQLERLELIDLATREGWRGTDRFSNELEALEENTPDLRDELGPDAYDRYLYERGQPNRVQIDSVISSSAADLGGLASGDLILSYAGERIFAGRELQQATRSGRRGELVQVVFQRDLASLVTELPRGPLGVTLSSRRVAPSS